MPCYKGIFPDELDGLIQDLLFTFATWVSYCNLCQQTDSTLATFERQTRELGKFLHKYKKTTSSIKTVETPTEVETRMRRDKDLDSTPRTKHFNLINYKNHALGHYPEWIREMGTPDGYNTQPVCLQVTCNAKNY